MEVRDFTRINCYTNEMHACTSHTVYGSADRHTHHVACVYMDRPHTPNAYYDLAQMGGA